MRNYPNQNKHFHQSHKSNRYQRSFKPSLNIDDYLNFNPSYSYSNSSTGQSNWNDNYDFDYHDGNSNGNSNSNARPYYNKNYYNGQGQRYNYYPKYDKEDHMNMNNSNSNYMPHFNTVSNYSEDKGQSSMRMNTTSYSNYNSNNNNNNSNSNNSYSNEEKEHYHSQRQYQTVQPNSTHFPPQKYPSSKQQYQNQNQHQGQGQPPQKTLKVAKSLTDISEAKASNTNEFNKKRNFPSKEELLRVKVNLKNEVKDIVVRKDDDCFQIAKAFVEENGLGKNLIQPIAIKLNAAIERITDVLLGKISNEDMELLENIKAITYKNKNNMTNNNSHQHQHNQHMDRSYDNTTRHERDFG